MRDSSACGLRMTDHQNHCGELLGSEEEYRQDVRIKSMDFGLSEEQEQLQRAAREFLTRECPPTFVREMYKEKDGFSRELHRKMAALGWTGLMPQGSLSRLRKAVMVTASRVPRCSCLSRRWQTSCSWLCARMVGARQG